MNGIIGDVNPTELPQLAVDTHNEAIAELNKKAKYSRSKEFQELKGKMEERIKFYQSYLPGGTPIVSITEEERGKYWAIADCVIGELQAVIDMYETANEEAIEIK